MRAHSILLVDDDPVFLETISALLNAATGANIIRAENGFAALRQLDDRAKDIGLLLCDLNMPDCDAVEVVWELSRRGLRTPIIFVTGAARPVVNSVVAIARAHRLNLVDTFRKPVELARLAVACERVSRASPERLALHR